MPWLRCQVEQLSQKTAEPIRGEFDGRSVYECAWQALCEWATLPHGGPVLTVHHGDRVWHVRREKVQAWRPLVRDDMARRMLRSAVARP